MAPVLKEAEAPVATTATAPSAAPHAKSPTEAPVRPQPVAVEIPVSVSGARSVDGSDKREPFAETTQTVLVFPHGTVIRISTVLVPGQLVFLTNEKTKKEVVCQVVKSKAGGAASGYVELQFTEPAVGFWGLHTPGAPAAAAPVAPRPATPSASSDPKAIPPVFPVVSRPGVLKPLTAPATETSPANAEVAPPPPPVEKAELAAPQSVALANPAPEISVAPPPPVAAVPESSPARTIPSMDAAPQTNVTPVPLSFPAIPPAPVAHKPMISTPALHDYSKEIDALFAVPHAPASRPAAPATPEPIPVAASSTPSSEELKLQAAHLQAQLNSLLFTETPAVPPAPFVLQDTLKTELPTAEVAKKVLEIAQDEPKHIIESDTKPAPPVHKQIPTSLSIVEEVKIPAWLAPLSQSSEPPAAEPSASGDVSSESTSGVSVNSEKSFDALVVNEPYRPQTAVFGGQLLGESSAPSEPVTSTGPKNALFLGLAAAALLILGGAWYFRQYHAGTATIAPVKPVASRSFAASAPGSKLSATGVASTPAANTVIPASASSPVAPQPAKNSAPVLTQAPSVIVPEARHFNSAPRGTAPEPKNFNPAPRHTAPVEPLKKSPLGDVHLAAPVVNRGADSLQDADALPAIVTDSSPPSGDALAAVASVRHEEPVAPLPVGGDVKPAQLLKSVPPEYPMVAKQEHISGSVKIDALIDTSGNVAAVNVLSGPPILRRAALDAVRQW